MPVYNTSVAGVYSLVLTPQDVATHRVAREVEYDNFSIHMREFREFKKDTKILFCKLLSKMPTSLKGISLDRRSHAMGDDFYVPVFHNISVVTVEDDLSEEYSNTEVLTLYAYTLVANQTSLFNVYSQLVVAHDASGGVLFAFFLPRDKGLTRFKELANFSG